MPKVTLSERDNAISRLAENLKLIECGRSSREMANVIGVSNVTYMKRRKHPETFTFIEIYKLCRNAGVSVADFAGGRLKLKGE